jgi:hypothetical protein
LKTGVARIGLGAEAEAGWAIGLRVVPVGLWFEEQTRAGTAAVVVLGEPLVVADLRAGYEQHPEDAVRAFTTQLQSALAGAVGAAQQLGQAHALEQRAARASWRGVGWAQQGAGVLLLAVGALPAVVGHIMALPGRAIA